MARVFIEMGELERSVRIREGVREEEHDVEMVETLREIEARLRDEDEEIALILTGPVEDPERSRMLSLFEARIPRPPVLGVREEGSEPAEPEDPGELLRLDEVLSLPVDPEEVRVVLAQQLERWRVQVETGIVGRTRAIRNVLERLHLVAPVHSTVLLTGESGTGKELVARAIHRYSPRRTRAFIAVNCAAMPESLLESELFGHEKGAFTGATSRRKGMFELADGGTIFLDEVAEMPPQTQTRLLRVLEQRRFMRVGGDEEIEVNVRVVAATNRDLMEAVRMGEFRRDLYYRLNVLHLEMPPLRERRGDIPVLVRRFIAQFTRDHGRDFKGLTSEAMEILLRYDWPGNIRELRNLVESMVVLAPGSVIRAEDIPEEIRAGRGRGMLPALTRRTSAPASPDAEGATIGRIPEMEFLFRTLVDLRMDVEDLKREFERYRERHPELLEGGGRWRGTEIEVSSLESPDLFSGPGAHRKAWRDHLGGAEPGPGRAEGPETEPEIGPKEEAPEPAPGAEEDEASFIRFRPGMTMSELEREAIVATLREVDGNRRRAAEKLGIGERTLYRKLKEYDIDL